MNHTPHTAEFLLSPAILQLQRALDDARSEGFAACQKQAVAALEEVKRDAYNDGYTVGQRNAGEGPAGDTVRLREENEQLRRVLELTRACNAAHLAEIKNLKAQLLPSLKANEEYLAEIKTLRVEVNTALAKNIGSYNEGYLLGRKDERSELFARMPWREIDEKSKEIKVLEQERHDWETLARERLEDVLNSQKEIAQLKKDNQNIAADGVRIFQEKSQEIKKLKSNFDAAARAYDKAAHQRFGEFAAPNFP